MTLSKKSMGTIFCTLLFLFLSTSISNAQRKIDLIPKKNNDVPNYYCTWYAQNYKAFQGDTYFNPDKLLGGSGSDLAVSNMTEKNIFGYNGWAKTFYPKERKELFFLIDAGWEIGGNFSLLLDHEKFPIFNGTPENKLKELNDNIKAIGWRGLGIWVRGNLSVPQAKTFVEWSKYAGIKYWKIDGGDADSGTFIAVTVKKELYPDLTIEQSKPLGPFNGDYSKDGKFNKGFPSALATSAEAEVKRIVSHSDVIRTYDVTERLSIPTTIQRIADLRTRFEKTSSKLATPMVEDEPYIAAADGCLITVHRYPSRNKRLMGDMDVFINGNRYVKRKIDAVRRLLRWQRIAKPIPLGELNTKTSAQRLTDSWVFRMGDTWASWAIGKYIQQSAPAIVAQNIKMPVVHSTSKKLTPYVIATKYPNGVTAIATLGRNNPKKGYYLPKAEVDLIVGDIGHVIGIFGEYKSLTLIFDKKIDGYKVFAQDVLANSAENITSRLAITGKRMILSGNIIHKIGTSAGTEGDISEPGLIVSIQK